MRAPGVVLAASARTEKARIFGSTVDVAGIGPAFARAYHFKWKKGPHEAPQANGALVSKSFADTNHLAVGDLFTVRPPSGRRLTFGVQAIFDPGQMDPLFGGIMISRNAFDSGFPRPKDLFTFVNVRGGATDSKTAALEGALASFPDVKIRTRDAWVSNRAHGVDQLLQFLYVLLALSVIVSLFGMVNTLVLSVFERTRELGMLRAIGMTRRQVRRMIRHESVITALIGAAIGIALGIVLAALLIARVDFIVLSVPVGQLIIFGIAAIFVGIIAAIFPARRAARLNVLEALQYE